MLRENHDEDSPLLKANGQHILRVMPFNNIVSLDPKDVVSVLRARFSLSVVVHNDETRKFFSISKRVSVKVGWNTRGLGDLVRSWRDDLKYLFLIGGVSSMCLPALISATMECTKEVFEKRPLGQPSRQGGNWTWRCEAQVARQVLKLVQARRGTPSFF